MAKEVAKALGYLHVDTGAMYRAVAWHCLENRIDPLDEKAVSRRRPGDRPSPCPEGGPWSSSRSRERT